MDSCSTDHVRFYLTGKKRGRWHVAPSAPSYLDVKTQLFEAHPLADLKRQELNAPGPVRRAFPDPHFPALSRETRSDLAGSLRRPGYRIPSEVARAILTAIASGKSKQSAGDHYGVQLRTVTQLVSGRSRPKEPRPAHPSYARALRQFASENAELTAKKLAALVNEKYGSNRSVKMVSSDARRFGIKLAKEPRSSMWRDLRPTLLAMMTSGKPLSRREIHGRLAELGVDVTYAALRNELSDLGLSHLARAEAEGVDKSPVARFDKAWPAIRGAMAENPGLTNDEIQAILERETGLGTTPMELSRLLAGRNDLPPRLDPKARGGTQKVKKSFEKAWPTLRSRIAGDPSLTDTELVAILSTLIARTVCPRRLAFYLRRCDDVPPRLKPVARKMAARRRAQAQAQAPNH
jgi:transposase